MKVGRVTFEENHCLVSVYGKTGVKRVPLVVSYMPLLEWLQRHPEKEDHEAPLWSSLSNNAKGFSIMMPILSLSKIDTEIKVDKLI